MNGTDLTAVLPLLVLGAGSVVVLLAAAFFRGHALSAFLTLLTLTVASWALTGASQAAPRQVTALLVLDGYALFYFGLLLAAAFAVTVISFAYLEKREGPKEEYYVLLLLATLGSAVLVMSSHFASFFLGLEVLSVSLYGLIAYRRDAPRAVEAGLKYLVLAGGSSAFLLFGMALLYADTGTLEFRPMAAVLASPAGLSGVLAVPGLALLVVGIGFKLGLVPFHMWTPDVYQGAPAPVTGFLATVSKGAMFALFLRYFRGLGNFHASELFLAFSLVAIASMLAGNLLALLQRNVKRILAYSSIAHLGYLLVAFLAVGGYAAGAVSFYLTAYFVTTLIAFGVVSVVSGPDGEEAEDLDAYRGLYWRRPWLAALFTAALFSLAGIPLTAGFLGKYYVLAVGVRSSLWGLALVLVGSSVIGLFYYLRVLVAMLSSPPDGEPAPRSAVPLTAGVVLGILGVLIVWFGVYPEPLIRLIQQAMGGMA